MFEVPVVAGVVFVVAPGAGGVALGVEDVVFEVGAVVEVDVLLGVVTPPVALLLDVAVELTVVALFVPVDTAEDWELPVLRLDVGVPEDGVPELFGVSVAGVGLPVGS